MQLDRLRYFHAVARAGSFTKAARQLRVSQPSVSKTVRLLEEHEGVTLLDRTGRGGVTLTPAGRRFLTSCDAIFEELECLRRAVIQEREECVGHLKVGASDNVCNYLMSELLAPFLLFVPARFSRLTPERRAQAVRRWRRSRFFFLRLLGDALKASTTMIYMSHPSVVAHIGEYRRGEERA